jgi:hypothetical protein
MRAIGDGTLGRQDELEHGASGFVRRDPQPPVMRLDDRATNRQSHAHTVGLGGEEGVEEPVHMKGRCLRQNPGRQ